MRPIEIIIVAGTALLLLGWAVGWRSRRVLPLSLLLLVVAHVLIEGQRASMWPVYAIVLTASIAALVRSGPRPPAGRGGRAVGRWVVAVLLLLVAVPLPYLWPVMKLPKPSGGYQIGQTWLVVVDSSRRERFSTDPGAVRKLPIKIWYPAPPGSPGTRAPYAQTRELAGSGLPPVLFGHVGLIKTHAIVDAPVASGEKFPVLVFSHGYGGNFNQNTVQMEELASHGYVVVSIAHSGEASWAPFPEGGGIAMDTGVMNSLQREAADPEAMKKAYAVLARFDSATTPEARLTELRAFLGSGSEPLRSESVAEWALDTRAVVDLLTRYHQGGAASPFQGRLDLDRLGIFGMSYGGATAGEFCRSDRRCKAAVNMDGGQYGGLINDSLMVPFLIIGSSQAYPVHSAVLELTRGPAYLIKVPETTHGGLSDLSLLAPDLLRWAGITGKLDPDRRERIMSAYLLGFFETHLRGNRSPLLDPTSTEFPDVSMIRRNVP